MHLVEHNFRRIRNLVESSNESQRSQNGYGQPVVPLCARLADKCRLSRQSRKVILRGVGKGFLLSASLAERRRRHDNRERLSRTTTGELAIGVGYSIQRWVYGTYTHKEKRIPTCIQGENMAGREVDNYGQTGKNRNRNKSMACASFKRRQIEERINNN